MNNTMLKILCFTSIVMNFMMAALFYQILSQFKILEEQLIFLKRRNDEISNFLKIKNETPEVLNQISSYDDYIWYLSTGLIVIGISLIIIGIASSFSGNSIPPSSSSSDSSSSMSEISSSADIDISQFSEIQTTSAAGTQTDIDISQFSEIQTKSADTQTDIAEIVSTGVNASVEMVSKETQTPNMLNAPFDVGKFLDTLSKTIKGLDQKLHKDFESNAETVTEQFDTILKKQNINNDIINDAICGTLNSVIEAMNKVTTALTNISGQGEIAIVQKIAENPNTYEQIGAIIDATKDSV